MKLTYTNHEVERSPRLSGTLADFAEKLLPAALPGTSTTASVNCKIQMMTEGQSAAQVFKFSYSDGSSSSLRCAWHVKVYSAEGGGEKYYEEVTTVEKCLDRLSKDLFSIHFKPLGECAGSFAVAYLDTDFSSDTEMVSLSEWICGVAPEHVQSNSIFIAKALENSTSALWGLAEIRGEAWAKTVDYFSTSWPPLIVFRRPRFESHEDVLHALIDGVGPAAYDLEYAGGESMKKIASTAPDKNAIYRSFPLKVTRSSENEARLAHNDVKIALVETARRLTIGDRVVICWRATGSEVATLHASISKLIERVSLDHLDASALQSALIDEIPNTLRSHADWASFWGGAHRDFHAGNLRVDASDRVQKLKIIDFSGLGEAPLFADLARLELSIWLNVAPLCGFSYSECRSALRRLKSKEMSPEDGNISPLEAMVATIRTVAIEGHPLIQRLSRESGLTSQFRDEMVSLRRSALREYIATLSLCAPIGIKWASERGSNDLRDEAESRRAGCALAIAEWCASFATELKEYQKPSHLWEIADAQEAEASLPYSGSTSAVDNNEAMKSPSKKSENIDDRTPAVLEGFMEIQPVVALQDARTKGTSSEDDGEKYPTVIDLWCLGLLPPVLGSAIGMILIDHFRTIFTQLCKNPLLPLQHLVLADSPFFSNSNLIIGGPPSSGKTFIADLLLLSDGIVRGRPSIYVAPTRALAQARYFQLLSLVPEQLHERILLSTGEDQDDDVRLYAGDFEIACMVYEKANIVFSIGGLSIRDVGVLVVDELHVMEDLNRGTTVEFLATKLKFERKILSGRDGQELPRIVLISTEQSLHDARISEWLATDGHRLLKYTIDERPVPVEHYLLIPDNRGGVERIHVTTMQSNRDLTIPTSVYRDIDYRITMKQLDGLRWKKHGGRTGRAPLRSASRESADLTYEALVDLIDQHAGGRKTRILVFGPSKKGLLLLGQRIKKAVRAANEGMSPPHDVLNALATAEPSTSIRELNQLVRCGVYLHNADIDQQIRLSIERRFGSGGDDASIEILLATSTLSYGVNLSVDYVFIIHPEFPQASRTGDVSLESLSIHEFQNMLGRAGRYGRSNCGYAYIVCGLSGISPTKDVLLRYYGVEVDRVANLKSRFLVSDDISVLEALVSSTGNVDNLTNLVSRLSYPFIRAILDTLRHMDPEFNADLPSGLPPSSVEVVTFLEHSLFWSVKADRISREFLQKAIDVVLGYCADYQIRIVDRYEISSERPRYRLTELGSAVIDTGTELTTLVPLLRWVAFAKNSLESPPTGGNPSASAQIRSPGNAGGPLGASLPIELFVFGLFLVPEVWRRAREFAPESRTHSSEFSSQAMIDANRDEVQAKIAVELEGLGITEPMAMIGAIREYVQYTAAPLLPGQAAYDGADAEVAFRLFSASVRWISGRPLEEVESLHRSDCTGARGAVDRFRSSVERMSWLAVALYRCVNGSADGRAGVTVRAGQEKPLLKLARRLRYGCASEGLVLINLPRSRLKRHHVAALVAEDLTIDRLLSVKPREAIQLVENVLSSLGVQRRAMVGLTKDLVDFAIRREQELSHECTRSTEETPERVDLRANWGDVTTGLRDMILEGVYRNREISQSLTRALRLLNDTRSRNWNSDEVPGSIMRVRGQILRIERGRGIEPITISIQFVSSLIEREERGLPPSVQISKQELTHSIRLQGAERFKFIVGIPWFLPHTVDELRSDIGKVFGACVLMTPSCLLCLVSLLQRGFLDVDDFAETLKEFSAGLHLLSVTDLPTRFPVQGLPVALREAMQGHFELVSRRRG